MLKHPAGIGLARELPDLFPVKIEKSAGISTPPSPVPATPQANPHTKIEVFTSKKLERSSVLSGLSPVRTKIEILNKKA